MSEVNAHPIRKAKKHIFQRILDDGIGADFLGRFYPYDTYPMFFRGTSAADVAAKMEQFRDDAISKHEAEVIRRQEQAKKMRARKENAQ